MKRICPKFRCVYECPKCKARTAEMDFSRNLHALCYPCGGNHAWHDDGWPMNAVDLRLIPNPTADEVVVGVLVGIQQARSGYGGAAHPWLGSPQQQGGMARVANALLNRALGLPDFGGAALSGPRGHVVIQSRTHDFDLTGPIIKEG